MTIKELASELLEYINKGKGEYVVVFNTEEESFSVDGITLEPIVETLILETYE